MAAQANRVVGAAYAQALTMKLDEIVFITTQSSINKYEQAYQTKVVQEMNAFMLANPQATPPLPPPPHAFGTLHHHIDAYVQSYETFLKAQTFCWDRWRVTGFSKDDQKRLDEVRAEADVRLPSAKQALKAIDDAVIAITTNSAIMQLETAAVSDQEQAHTVDWKGFFAQKTCLDLGLDYKLSFKEALSAKLLCVHTTYRGFIIAHLLGLA
jgi:hypothetical protein